MVQMRPGIPTPNCPTENGEKWPENDRKMAQMTIIWPKMVLNVKANGPNEARNTNTKLPNQKWGKID